MELLKITALTSGFSIALALLLELWFGLSSRPYLFGFPHRKWPMFVAFAIMWIVSFGSSYYLLWQRATFYAAIK
jgi:hypothetical protein